LPFLFDSRAFLQYFSVSKWFESFQISTLAGGFPKMAMFERYAALKSPAAIPDKGAAI